MAPPIGSSDNGPGNALVSPMTKPVATSMATPVNEAAPARAFGKRSFSPYTASAPPSVICHSRVHVE